MQEAMDESMFEEPTVAEEEREVLARENMAHAVAELVSLSVPVSAVLVVARGPGLPTGVLLGDREREQPAELDPVILGEILANAHDDCISAALLTLLLGDAQPIGHTVARDQHGTIMAVVAVRTSKRVTSAWLGNVLTRAANSLAGWLAVEATWSWPPQALLDALHEPALAHDGGMVIVANSALARLLGREPNDVVGMPVSRVVQRLPALRSCSLVVGGRPRPALIFDRRIGRLEANLRDAVEVVLAKQYAFLRQTSRVLFDHREPVVAVAAPKAVEELVSLALLEMTTIFAKPIPGNQVRIGVYREDKAAVIELVATGALAHGADIEHLGAIICASRARSMGGHFAVEVSRPDARAIRISLPVEA
jgi:hypothetical protein